MEARLGPGRRDPAPGWRIIIVGIIAHAPVDVVTDASYAMLERFGLARHECTTMSLAANADLASALEQEGLRSGAAPIFLPGGCGANMAAWLGKLGGAVSVVAPFGQDANGAFARRDLEARGVRIVGFDYDGPHTLIYTLITPDRERTFAAYYHGLRYDLVEAARQLRHEKMIVIDGYLLLQPGVIEGLRAYLTEDRPQDQEIVFCPGDVSVLTEAAEAAAFVLARCDHLIMNRNEAAVLFPGQPDEAVAEALRARGIGGVITRGEEGAFLFDAGAMLHVPCAVLDRPIVNTNGAGDAFTAGYVHGMDKGLALNEVARLATACAAEILVTQGARPERVPALA